MKHRKPGHPGIFTIHAPDDYRPRHRRTEVIDVVTGRPATAYTPPEHLAYVDEGDAGELFGDGCS